jgi:PGF-pre-PGF domain-containing protein
MNRKIVFIGIILCIVLLSGTGVASDWHQFQNDDINSGITKDKAPIEDPTLDEYSWEKEFSISGWSGIDCTPLVVGDVVYTVTADNKVYAVNRTTGDVDWITSTSGSGFLLSTPAYGNGMIFVPTKDGCIYALDADNGEKEWNVTVSGKQINTPVTYEDNRIYFGDWLYSGTGSYYCYDGEGNECWNRSSSASAGYYWAGAAVIGDYLVYGDDGSHLTSVYKINGTTVDEINIDAGNIRSSVVFSDGKVYFTTKDGQCHSIPFDEVEGIFDKSAHNQFSIEQSTSTPTIYNGRLYVGSADKLWCLNSSDLTSIWNYGVSGNIQSSPVLSTYHDDGNGEVYIYFTENSNAGKVYCLKDYSGNTQPELQWSYGESGKTDYSLAGVAISDGWIYYGTDSKYLFGFTNEIPLETIWEGTVTLKPGQFEFVPTNDPENTHSMSNFSDVAALYEASEAGDFVYDITDEWYSSMDSFFINGIGGIQNEPYNPGKSRSWNLFINGEHASKGLGHPLNSLVDGDTLSFWYCPNDENLNPLLDKATYVVNISVAIEEPESDGKWHQFQKDSRNNGFSSSSSPLTSGILWTTGELGAVAGSSTVIGDGLAYVNCNDTLKAVNISNGNVEWSASLTPNTLDSWATPAYDDGMVFMNGGGAFDAKTGEVIWDGLPVGCNGGVTVADKKIFLGDWNEDHYTCYDEYTGEQLWSIDVNGTSQGTPAYYKGKLFLTSWGSEGDIYCLNANTGAELWSTHIETPACGSPAVHEDIVYITTYLMDYGMSGKSSKIHAFHASNGTEIWNQSIVATDATPVVADGRVYVSGGMKGLEMMDEGQTTYCFDALGGDLLWQTTEEESIGSWYGGTAAIADGLVFVGSESYQSGYGMLGDYKDLYALDMTTGNIVWHGDNGGSAPAILNGIVYSVGEGKLHAYDGSKVTVYDDSVCISSDNLVDKKALNATGLTYDGTDGFLNSIGGISNDFSSGIPEESAGWSIWLNGEIAGSGFGDVTLEEGDHLQYLYTSYTGDQWEPNLTDIRYELNITVCSKEVLYKDSVHLSSANLKDKKALNATGLTYDGTDGFLNSIGGISNDFSSGIPEESAGWSIWLNGEITDSGFGDVILEEGDRLQYLYTSYTGDLWEPNLKDIKYEVTIDIHTTTEITSVSPVVTEIADPCGRVREFSATLSDQSDVFWILDGKEVQYNESVVSCDYSNWNAGVGLHNLTVIVENEYGSDSCKWNWTIIESDEENIDIIIPSKSKEVSGGNVTTFDFEDNSIPTEDGIENSVMRISFNSSVDMGPVNGWIEILNDSSTRIPDGSDPAGEMVYQRMNIEFNNSSVSSDGEIVGNRQITFKISKQWVAENNVDVSSVTMYHHDGETWIPLDTHRESDLDTPEYFCFTAVTDSFSPFTISADYIVSSGGNSHSSGGGTGQATIISNEDEPETDEKPVVENNDPETSENDESQDPIDSQEKSPDIIEQENPDVGEYTGENPKESQNAIPGFESVFAIAGLVLSAVLLMRRND